jgi:hypothetical protein
VIAAGVTGETCLAGVFRRHFQEGNDGSRDGGIVDVLRPGPVAGFAPLLRSRAPRVIATPVHRVRVTLFLVLMAAQACIVADVSAAGLSLRERQTRL